MVARSKPKPPKPPKLPNSQKGTTLAWIAGDRIKETTTTTGTGDIALAGAVSGFQAFSARCANGDVVFYAIAHQAAAEWEVGLGTWVTGNTLQRTAILQSSNSDAAVNFSAGTKDVFCTQPSNIGQLPATNQGWSGGNLLVPDNTSIYVVDEFEIPSGKTLELRSLAIMEIG